MRIADEDEDELALPAKHNRMCASTVVETESLATCTFVLGKLAKLDPNAIYGVINDARLEIETWRNQKNSLEATRRHEREAHKLKQQSDKEQYHKLDKNFKDLKSRWESSLLPYIEDDGTRKPTDDTFKSLWGQLSYNIKNVVHNYLGKRPQDEPITLNGYASDHYWQPMLPDEIILLRRSINRRRLWSILYLNLFSGNGNNCHGEISQTLVSLISRLDPRNLPSPRRLQMISRIKSALDLDIEQEANPDSDTKLEELFQNTVTSFQDLVPERIMNQFEIDMRKIISDAWDLHTAMMASKAIYIMQWSEDGDGKNNCPYNPETMESFDYDNSIRVSELTAGVVESPVLWKIGNGDGENFDSSMVLCRHCVLPAEKKDETSICTLDESSS